MVCEISHRRCCQISQESCGERKLKYNLKITSNIYISYIFSLNLYISKIFFMQLIENTFCNADECTVAKLHKKQQST